MWNNFTGLLKRGPVSWHMQVHWRRVGLLWKSVATSWWLTGTAGWDGVWRGVCCVSVRGFFFRFRSSRHQRDGAKRSGVNWCGGFTLVTSRDASKQTDVSGRNACRTLRGACNNVWALCCELYDSGSRSRGRKVPRYRQRTYAPPTADTPTKMTVMSCASPPPASSTKQSWSFPLGLLSRAALCHTERTKTNGCHSGNGLIVSGRP